MALINPYLTIQLLEQVPLIPGDKFLPLGWKKNLQANMEMLSI